MIVPRNTLPKLPKSKRNCTETHHLNIIFPKIRLASYYLDYTNKLDEAQKIFEESYRKLYHVR